MLQEVLHSDQVLASQLQKGNIEAFDTIYHRYKTRLYYCALHYLGQQDEAEEIVQNTFVMLWERRANIEESKSLKNFLFRIAINQVFDFLKHQVVQNQYAADLKHIATEEDHSTQKEIYFNDLTLHLEKIIDKLPNQQQRVFKMSRWEGLSNEEIAHNLGISIRTAENLLYRATKYIRENIVDENMLVLFIVYYSISSY